MPTAEDEGMWDMEDTTFMKDCVIMAAVIDGFIYNLQSMHPCGEEKVSALGCMWSDHWLCCKNEEEKN